MEQKVQLLAGKSAQLEMDKGRLNSEIEIFQERVDKFSDKELEKQQSLAQVTAKILDASAKLNQIQEEVARAEREVAETHHRAERKKLELADLEKQAVETNHQVSELREKAAKVRGNLEQLQRKSEESAEEHEAVVKKLGSVLESAAHANLQIAAKNEELRQSANAVFTAKRELDSVNSEMERVKAELKKLAKAEFLNWEVIDMEKEIERRRDEFQRFMRSCADKESAISTKMAELDEVVSEKQLQAQDKETARKSLEHRMAELEQQYSVKKTELDRVLRNGRHKQTVYETEEAKKQLSRVLLDVAEQKQKFELLETQARQAKEDSGKYLDICEISRVDLQKTKDEHNKVKRMIQELMPVLSARKADCELLQNQLQYAQQNLDHLKKEMAELDREKDHLVHHNYSLKMEKENQEKEASRQRAEMMEGLRKLDDLQTNLRAKKSALEKLDTQAQAQFLHQHQVLENGEISRLFEGEIARLQKQLETVKAQSQIDLQNLQKVHAAKEARRKSKIGHLKKRFSNLQLEYHSHMELTQKQIVLLAESIKADDLKRNFVEIGKIHRELSQLLSQKASEARKSHSHDFENPIKLAEIEKDAEISFLVAQLQKLQKENRELEKTASESQKLMTKFHNKLRKAEQELQKHNLYLPFAPATSPSSPLSIPSEPPVTPPSAHSPLPATARYSPSHILSQAPSSIPTTPPTHIPSSHSSYPPNLSSKPSPPLSSQPSLSLSSHSSPHESHYPSPPLHPTDGYFLAQIPRPNPEIPASHKLAEKTGAKKSSASDKAPELLEKENSKLREQCDSLTQKLYKSQQLFIQKLTELQGDREELKTRLERLENSPSHTSPPPSNPSPFQPTHIPPSSLPSYPRHPPPYYRVSSPTLPSHFRPSPPPQKYSEYVTPEDWIFAQPSLN